MSNIGTVVKSVQDIMRKDAGVSGDAQRIEQLAWIFFLKILDDRERVLEATDDDFRSPVPKRFKWRNWAADPEGITGDALLEFVGDLFKTLKELPSPRGDRRAALVREAFQDSFNYMKNGTLLRQVLNKVQSGIDFARRDDLHLFGDIYEKILSDLQSAGNAGEYYTPRAVTQFIVDIIAPKLGETVLDPSCGTGGFLTSAIEHVRAKYVKKPKDEELLHRSIRGMELKQLPYSLATTNLILHGIDVPDLRHDDTLSRPLRDYGPADAVDVIVTNPPFGGQVAPGIIHNFPAQFQSSETSVMFLALFLTVMKPGARAGIVLPDGFLFGEGVHARIKEKLMAECDLHTIVRLPKGVFAPYTSINTNLLFFTKGAPTKKVWFYEHPYPAGYKSYSKTKPIRIREFEAEKAWWGSDKDGFKARVETDRAWSVGADEIRSSGFNLDRKNPRAPEAPVHDPDVLLANYGKLAAESDVLRGRLRDLLALSFDRKA